MSGLMRLSVDEGRLIMQLNLARDKCRVIANKINRYPTVRYCTPNGIRNN